MYSLCIHQIPARYTQTERGNSYHRIKDLITDWVLREANAVVVQDNHYVFFLLYTPNLWTHMHTYYLNYCRKICECSTLPLAKPIRCSCNQMSNVHFCFRVTQILHLLVNKGRKRLFHHDSYFLNASSMGTRLVISFCPRHIATLNIALDLNSI